MEYLPHIAGAFLLSVVVAAGVRVFAPRFGLLDAPRQDRWHLRPVPRLGGIAIYLGFTVAVVTFRSGPRLAEALPLLLGGCAIFVVGLIDDLFRLENRPKFILLLVCSIIPVSLGVRFESLPYFIGAPLAIIWILGATNAFNWLDNMDGVAAGIGAIAAMTLVGFSLQAKGGGGIYPALMLAGALLGFLVHNYPPAKLFMGDAGSGFIGFTLAMIAMMGSSRDVSNVLLTVLVPGLILAVPIFDTALVTLQRVKHRRPIFQGGRDHPAHRLVAMGLPERKAVLLLYGLSTLAGVGALAASTLPLTVALITSVVLGLTFLALGLVLSEIRVYESEPGGNGVTALPPPFLNKRWIVVMCLDIVLSSVAYVGAHLLRYEGALSAVVAETLVRTLPVMVGAKMVGFYLAGVYRGMWRYAGILDYTRIVQGATIGSLLGIVVLFLWMRLEGFSRSALFLDWFLTLGLVGGSRLSLTALREYIASQAEVGERVLIFGAGRGGVLLLQELRQNGTLGFRPVGFVDDDPMKRGTIVQGLRVLGDRGDLARLVHQYRVDEVLLAIPSGSLELIEQVKEICAGMGTKLRRLELTLQ